MMPKKKAMLIDVSRCVGCHECQNACQEENKLPDLDKSPKGGLTKFKDAALRWPLKPMTGQYADGRLNDIVFTTIENHKDKDGGDIFVRQLCRHCHEPACQSVCLVNAFHKTPEGAVLYDGKKCIGCRYCMQACPFFIPKYEWGSAFPWVRKCVLCHKRIAAGGTTACAEACKNMGIEATIFGEYDEIVAEAAKRLSEGADLYAPKIYGLKEAGGTSVLYISPVPFEELGFDTRFIPESPMPDLTMAALSKVPNVVGIGAALLGGIWWITNRRQEVEQHECDCQNNSDHQNK
jgi:formate dehydrogenase iron-sulfur subunit